MTSRLAEPLPRSGLLAGRIHQVGALIERAALPAQPRVGLAVARRAAEGPPQADLTGSQRGRGAAVAAPHRAAAGPVTGSAGQQLRSSTAAQPAHPARLAAEQADDLVH